MKLVIASCIIAPCVLSACAARQVEAQRPAVQRPVARRAMTPSETVALKELQQAIRDDDALGTAMAVEELE